MGGRTVLVGRDSELSELASAIESAVTGSPTAVLVHGEAGVGKTRLVTEAMARGELHGVRALWGRCLRFGTAESSAFVNGVLDRIAGAVGRSAED